MADTKIDAPTTAETAPEAAAPPAGVTEGESAKASEAEMVEAPKAAETATEKPETDAAKPEESKPDEPKAEATSEPATNVDAAAAKATEAPEKTAEEKTPKTTFNEFAEKLPEIIKEVGHGEMWGVTLSTDPLESHVPTQIVLQKFLNANEGDLPKAIEQLKGALQFRKEKKPLELLNKVFSGQKFGELGLVTVYESEGSEVPDVFTWNLYGNVKDRIEDVFVPLDDFLDYRIALQELSLKYLSLPTATVPITSTSDPYKIYQVHDYASISFFRQPPSVRSASTTIIKLFALSYPELLREKFFVNVPAVMGWVYGLLKLFVAEQTRKKFHPMADGKGLVHEFGDKKWAKKWLPKEYGGENGNGDRKLKALEGTTANLKFDTTSDDDDVD